MAKISPKQKTRIEHLINQIKDYLDVRFEHASRVNPRIANIYEDMVYQFLSGLRNVLGLERMYGEHRFMVADILTSADERKKQSLIDPIDQNSIMTLVVGEKAEAATDKKRAGLLDVDDLPTLYAALDPSMKSVMELIQIWVWWDLRDASYMAAFYERFAELKKTVANNSWSPEKVMPFIQSPKPEWKLEELKDKLDENIDANERVGRLFIGMARIRNWFTRVRDREEAYQMILKRKESVSDASEARRLIVEGGKRLMAIDKVRQSDSLEPALLSHYSKTLQRQANEITPSLIVQYENEKVQDLLPRLQQALSQDSQLGEPFDFKRYQSSQMSGIVQSLRKSLQIPDSFKLPTIESEVLHEKVADMPTSYVDGDEEEEEETLRF